MLVDKPRLIGTLGTGRSPRHANEQIAPALLQAQIEAGQIVSLDDADDLELEAAERAFRA